MSNTNDIPRAAAHMDCTLDDPEIFPVTGFPGMYAIRFGGLSIHCTAERWQYIDAAVRAEMGLAARKAVIGHDAVVAALKGGKR